MLDNYHTTHERLLKAVNTLAQGTESLQKRLKNAYSSDLSPLRKEDFPIDLQADFDQLEKKFTNQKNLQQVIQKMTEAEAIELSEKIVAMYDKVARKHCS